MLKIFTKISPEQFLSNVKNEIHAHNIHTWEIDHHGFTHTSAQWKNKAWVKLHKINDDSLEFSLLYTKDHHMNDETKGVYYGHFSQMILSHFKKDFSTLEIES